jgi:hypothetical protein
MSRGASDRGEHPPIIRRHRSCVDQGAQWARAGVTGVTLMLEAEQVVGDPSGQSMLAGAKVQGLPPRWDHEALIGSPSSSVTVISRL